MTIMFESGTEFRLPRAHVPRYCSDIISSGMKSYKYIVTPCAFIFRNDRLGHLFALLRLRASCIDVKLVVSRRLLIRLRGRMPVKWWRTLMCSVRCACCAVSTTQRMKYLLRALPLHATGDGG